MPKPIYRGTSNKCPDCGKKIHNYSERCRKCAGLHRRRPRTHGSGYIRIFVPGHPLAKADGYVFEHRLVVYKAGIEIPPGYHVHHRNGDRTDNRLENLEVLPGSTHVRDHVRMVGSITNQFGVWPLLTDEERRRKQKERNDRRYRKGGDASEGATQRKADPAS